MNLSTSLIFVAPMSWLSRYLLIFWTKLLFATLFSLSIPLVYFITTPWNLSHIVYLLQISCLDLVLEYLVYTTIYSLISKE